MAIFELILALLLGAAVLSMVARAIKVPYPTLLALGGAGVALVPGVPGLSLPSELILALFVAPVLLDASHDASLRDLRRQWRPILSLIMVAVGLTTVVVALVAHACLPDMPWAAAIALGALLAPPDAVAAIAVLRQVSPPYKLRIILEGESLFNDASSLLIYNLAVGAVAAGHFSIATAVPAFLLTVFGSVIAGWGFARLVMMLTARIDDGPTAIIVQFVATFGVWLVAEHLGLSGVVTVVVFGLTAGRRATTGSAPDLRVTSFATWETVTFVLNVLAFTLIGLQLRELLVALDARERHDWVLVALSLLGVVILVRLGWTLGYGFWRRRDDQRRSLTAKNALVVGWSGMRGVVTLAAALALPERFPYRDFILLAAFTVVLGTLVVQGLTLGPLLRWLDLPADTVIEDEIAIAREAALGAALTALKGQKLPAAERLRGEYRDALARFGPGDDPAGADDNALRRSVVPASRRALDRLRGEGRIGDDAYRKVEQELDWLELSARA